MKNFQFISRVIDSCQTMYQLSTTINWLKPILNERDYEDVLYLADLRSNWLTQNVYGRKVS